MLILRGAPALSAFRMQKFLNEGKKLVPDLGQVYAEYVHFGDLDKPISEKNHDSLKKLLKYGSIKDVKETKGAFVLVTPRPGTISPWSSKSTDIAHNCGLSKVIRLERGISYYIDANELNDEQKVIKEILLDPGVIRNKLKVRSAVTNAQLFIGIQNEFGSFSNYLWAFVNNKPMVNKRKSMSEVPVTTEESDALSKDLKKRGFKFCGSTIMYAYMQACGLVNDHTTDCFRYKEV